LDISPGEAHNLHVAPVIKRQLMNWDEETRLAEVAPYLYAYYLHFYIFFCETELKILQRP
jgi:hypothetical protein